MQANILLFTPRLRFYGRAFMSVHAARVHYGQPIYSLETQHMRGNVGEPTNPQERRESGGNVAICAQYAAARDMALCGGFTHLLTIEDDMVIPPDAIDRLLAADAAVAYGLYCWRWGDHRWSAYRYVLGDNGESWGTDAPHVAAGYFERKQRVSVAGLGLGCTMIRRDALEAIPFRLPDGATAANDWYFALDCQSADIEQVCDFGCVCGHMTLTPSPRIIYPCVNAAGFADSRIDYLDLVLPGEG